VVVTDGKVVVWLRLIGVADKISDVIADVNLNTTADEACADGAEADGSFIVIKMDNDVDRCRFPFLYLLEYDSCNSHVFP
jgi:hypothetical protein